MSTQRIRLGDMLIAARIVTAEQVDAALAVQRDTKQRLGEVLVELGHVSEVQLAQVLSNQLSIPWVNLHHVDFSRELLNLVPAEVALKHSMVPVYVRRVRQQGDTLFVGTDDPLNEGALIQVASHVGMPVKPMVAATSDVRNAIRVYYFAGKDLPGRPSRRAPAAAKSTIPPMELDPTELEEWRSRSSRPPVVDDLPKSERPSQVPPEPRPLLSLEPPSEAGAPGSEPPEPTEEAPPAVATLAEPTPTTTEPSPAAPSAPIAAEPSAPVARPRPKKKPRFVTLTLLDGTKVTLPAPEEKTAEPDDTQHHLTTRDLLSALVARTQGKDVSAVLDDDRWELLFAALLSVLMRKGLVADWEFVEEWNRIRR